MLDEGEDALGGAHRGRDAQQVEVLLIAGVVHAGHDVLHPEVLLGHLPDDDVVLIVAGDGDAHVGAGHAGGLQHEQLGAVAVAGHVLELGLQRGQARRAHLDDGHLVPQAQQRARHVGTGLATADDDRVHQASSWYSAAKARRAPSIMSMAVRVGQMHVRPCCE